MNNNTNKTVTAKIRKYPWECLVDSIIHNYKKGDMIAHSVMQSILNIPYRKACGCLNSRYTYQISKANNKLIDLSLILEPIQGYGYRVAMDHSYESIAAKFLKTGIKNIERAQRIVNNADTSTLSSTQQKQYNDTSSNINIVLSAINQIQQP